MKRKDNIVRKFMVLFFLLGIVALTAVACTSAAEPEPVTEPEPVVEAEPEVEPELDIEPLDSGGQVPFYARFGGGEMFSDGEWTTIVFYRPADCIPPDFNMMQFFDFPGEAGPGAMGCNPPTIASLEYWENGPETDPAPLRAETTGLGAVPIWFVSQADLDQAIGDDVVTIGELASLPSLIKGTAETYEELLYPSQTNEVSRVDYTGRGTLEDGRSFEVVADYEGGSGTMEISFE
jgi:hypothetical protein